MFHFEIGADAAVRLDTAPEWLGTPVGQTWRQHVDICARDAVAEEFELA